MTTHQKLNAISTTCEEVLTPEELKRFLDSDMLLKHYVGFEISGKVHLGGLVSMLTIKALQEAGVATSCFLADWHSYINHKLGGNLNVIRQMATEYFKEALTACALCVDAEPEKIRFILASDIYNNDYWALVIETASHMTISRSKRSVSIAGREAGDEASLSWLFYPAMQVADIFHMGITIAQAGLDQRKAHVIARTVAPKITRNPLLDDKGNIIKPVALHTPLLLGLGKPSVWPIPEDQKDEVTTTCKMSKSKPDSAIFIHDEPEEIRRKIKAAFCPPGDITYNPIVDWVKRLIFPIRSGIKIERPEKFGGTLTIASIEEFMGMYQNNEIHPDDLKSAVSDYLIDMLSPARKYFEHPDRKKALRELEEIGVTR